MTLRLKLVEHKYETYTHGGKPLFRVNNNICIKTIYNIFLN